MFLFYKRYDQKSDIQLVLCVWIYKHAALLIRKYIYWYMHYMLLLWVCTGICYSTLECSPGVMFRHDHNLFELLTHHKSMYVYKKGMGTIFEGAFGCYPYNVHIIESFNTLHATHITVLINQNNKKFIVKQGTRSDLAWHLRVVRDRLGAEIAEWGNIRANRVVMIPAYFTFPGKLNSALPATLHEFVSGVSVRSLPAKSWARIFIHQKLKEHTPKEKRGLTQEVIRGMANHKDLCKIVALDTFIANVDRHHGNLFYDERSKQFTAIDLEHSFADDLAQYACRSIQLLLDGKMKKLSTKELHGLSIYRDTLQTLIKLYTPLSMYTKLVDFSKEAGMLLKPFQLEVAKKLKQYEVSIHKNYASCQQLVILLDRLIQQYGK